MSDSNMRWSVSHPALERVWNVCGFKSESKAFDHLDRHFLNEAELWHQLVDEPSPRRLGRQLKESGCAISRHPDRCRSTAECAPLVADGVNGYLDAVRNGCADIKMAALVLRRETDKDDPFRKHVRPMLVVASADGFFASFENAPPSHLATAFRPAPVDGGGKARRQDFRKAAIRQLEKNIDESEALERRLGKTVKELADEQTR